MFRQNGKITYRETLAKIIFLLAPTLVLCYFLLWNANQYYAVVLKNQAFQQTGFLGLGMLGAALFYHFRFRFLPTFALLILGQFLIYKGLDRFSIGEFDTFFVSVQFLIFSITFSLGWIIGWGFTQLRYFSILISGLFLFLSIILLSRQNELFFVFNKQAGLKDYGFLFGPVVIYCVYVIFTAELIYSYRTYDGGIWWSMSRRLIGFVVLALIFFMGVLYFQRGEIKDTLANYGGGGKEGDQSMLHRNKDNTFNLKDYSKLSGSLGRTNQLLFAAHIDNFFEGSEIPNPLYLTAFYYSKFDTATQTFETDKNIPDNDLFQPDPSKIPLFSTQTDSSVLKDALKDKYRRTVDIEVYKTALSASSYMAPSLGFFVQPITVEKDFRNEFRSAYRAKSYISELNSAYFVYNAPDPMIKAFQEQRFKILRQVTNYKQVNHRVMDYYTYMPKGIQFDRIKRLADSIESGKTLPIDKVLAIRDYFLARDPNGKPYFSYTDNPGVPDIPNASLLNYFLFKSKKGYCAYYAGATLFLLRAMGIPSRIAVGFLTVDRSGNKNPGWYWFYADQAHAWVQVLFPGYGWLDFDTTVGNDDARESPQPDGTPPMQPPKAYLATDGKIISVDTVNKRASIEVQRFVFHDKKYQLANLGVIQMDLSIATIQRDSTYLELKQVRIGDSATAVSYANIFKNLSVGNQETAIQLLKRFPKIAPIDELHLRNKSVQKENEALPQKSAGVGFNILESLIWGGAVVLFLLLFFLALPYLILVYYRIRLRMAKSLKKRSYWTYLAVTYYCHVVFRPKGDETYLQYAKSVDDSYNTVFQEFIKSYLKLKYGNSVLLPSELNLIEGFLKSFLGAMKQRVKFVERFKSFLRVFRAISFFAGK